MAIEIELGANPRPTDTEAARHKFFLLVRSWKEGRNPTLNSSRMAKHPAYQAIIRMGAEAVPLILDELAREPDEWFFALTKITGHNPITDAHRGRFSSMVKAWLDWGRAHGLAMR